MCKEKFNDELVGANNIFMTTLFLHEKREREKAAKKKYAEYIDTFPSDVSTIPVFYTDGEQEWLKGTQIPNRIEKIKDFMELYDPICQAVPEFKELATYEEFSKTLILMSTRLFTVN